MTECTMPINAFLLGLHNCDDYIFMLFETDENDYEYLLEGKSVGTLMEIDTCVDWDVDITRTRFEPLEAGPQEWFNKTYDKEFRGMVRVCIVRGEEDGN